MNRKRALLTLFLVVMVDLIGFGIVLPLLPFFAQEFNASAWQIGFLFSIYSLAQFIFSPLWGGLSDAYGRRPILMISVVGSVLAYGLFATASSYEMLFLSRLLAGMMAGNIGVAQAYIADITPEEGRAKGMALIGAAFGIGFVIGPALSLISLPQNVVTFSANTPFAKIVAWMYASPYAAPGLFAATLSLMSLLLICFVLEESRAGRGTHHELKLKKIISGRLNMLYELFLGLLSFINVKRARVEEVGGSNIKELFIMSWVMAFGHSSLYAIFPLFCNDSLGLSMKEIGLAYVWMGLLALMIQGGLIRILLKLYSETFLFIFGSACIVVGFIVFPICTVKWHLYFVLSCITLGASLNGPTLTSLISKASIQNEYGETMGTAQGMSGLGRLIGPSWGGVLYGLNQILPFWATAIVLTTSLRVGWRLVKGTGYGVKEKQKC